MKNVSVKISDDLHEQIDEYQGEDETRSDAIRDLLKRGLEHEYVAAERDDLRRQLAAANQRIDDVGELVEYVEEEREVQRDRRALEQRRAEAGLMTRAGWWLVGMDADDE